MTSRLDRLFVLLDTGSSPVTRKAAALQLGEVQKLHPHELHNLLAKVHHYLRSPQWESRIAAGEAIEAIVKNVPQWSPVGINTDDGQVDSNKVSLAGRMKFQQFDINKVLRNGACLLASEGREFEMEENHGVEQKELLARQRSLLNKRLGLDELMGFSSAELFSNEDLLIIPTPKIETKEPEISKKAIAEMVEAEMLNLDPGLSSRERNRAKRKAKLVAKQRSQEAAKAAAANTSKNEPEEIERKRLKLSNRLSENKPREENYLIDSSSNSSSLFEESGDWPFQFFCDQLCQDLFHPSWEVRHGAATALRAIVRNHGTSAGKTADMSQSQMELYNQIWLEDTALRLLCGIALDRFGDFISDQVVAPVRETCAQTLAAVLNIMSKECVFGVTHVLLQLLKQQEWEARHGGLLGMKYLLAVRQDLTVELLHLVFAPIYEGLQDEVDDVCAVAAAALVPISDILVRELPTEVPGVISTLWCLLLDQDDVTTSTNSIMTLLSSLLSYPLRSTHYSPSSPLNELVPRLWPFLGHSSSSVRKGALQTLFTLTSGNNPEPEHDWLSPILEDALKHIYQRCIMEHVGDILELVYELWRQVLSFSSLESLLTAACPALSGWLCLAMQPSVLPISSELLIEAKHKIKEKTSKCRHPSLSDSGIKDTLDRHYIGGFESLNDTYIGKNGSIIRARCYAAKLLGLLSCFVTRPMPGIMYTPDMESPLDTYAKLLLFHLTSRSALQRLVAALVVMEWAKQVNAKIFWPASLVNKLFECLNENIYYDEVMHTFGKMQQECRDFLNLLQVNNIKTESVLKLGAIISTSEVLELCSNLFPSMIQQVKLKPKALETLEERRKSLTNIATQAQHEQNNLQTTVQATVAGAVVCIGQLPEKLNPVIKPLMDSIKKEENGTLQQISAVSLTKLLSVCMERSTCPNAKIIKNICSFVASDFQYTPRIDSSSVEVKNGNPSPSASHVDSYSGIVTLTNMQKNAEKNVSIRRSNSVSKNRASISLEMNVDDTIDDETQQQAIVQRRGAQYTLIEIAKYFGEKLPESIPKLWEVCLGPLIETIDPDSLDFSKYYGNDSSAQDLVNTLQVLEVVGPVLHSKLKDEVVGKLSHLCQCLNHPYAAVRHMAARCIGMLSKIATGDTMNLVLEHVLPCFDNSDNDTSRQGAIEAISNVIDCLGFDLVPYIALLVIPVLGRMSDSNIQVRLMATHCFATLIRLMPLEGGVKDPVGLNPTLVKKKQQERVFLDQLFDIKKLRNYEVPVPISAQLRTYQQDGVNWLSFLNIYKLHGILCDDMGLGKTLQSLCMLAGDHFYQEQEIKKSKSGDRKLSPSIVICPPTLTGHWIYEVEKFIEKNFLNPLHYTGPPAERQRLRAYFNKSKKHNLVIVSYDIVRNDIDFFSSIRWNYCILDEGHIIKNGKTKLSKAIKQLVANHRIILSGTPIQNNVLELWSLFDFLMPGFLGTEKQFMSRYSKPILLSRDAKSSSKEQEAGALAMEALHRQVLPFLLRRMKEDVLQDLPPKIIQDYYCELSSLQKQLYEDFSKTRAKRSLDDCFTQEESFNNSSTSHIFQALQYLRKVCNHPKLVLNPVHPEYEKLNKMLKESKSSLADISHAAKLLALKQLLLDCGIGTEPSSSETTESVVNQHRALIFCQLKSMLDILEKDLLKIHLPSVTYLRLDGTIPPGSRYDVVHRFNNDPSIDVLLLTTRVGGLGLNLTGADTVIFVEHDWNPMKDLQAMDRVHRIGQKKVVNVYRLITKGTLEEKIMGLQKFKLTIANTVISQDNSSLLSMGTDQLLDLFSLGENTRKNEKGKMEAAAKGSGMNNILESLPELWDDKQYEEEYDLNNFMQSLRKQ